MSVCACVRRGSGFLEFEDLQRAVESIGGTAISESALRTVFAEADTDADGKVPCVELLDVRWEVSV